MTKYLSSEKVKMYPSAYRSAEKDVEANFTSENNVTKSNTLGFNHKSFVEENVNSLTIVCKGYRFEVLKSEVVALFDNSPDAIYVGIRTIYKVTTPDAFNSLVNFENDDRGLDHEVSTSTFEFQGLAFSDIPSSDFYLQILEKDGTSYKVPDKSKLVIKTTQIEGTTNKPISQEFSTGNLTATGDITFTKIETTTGTKAVTIDSSGKLNSTDNSSSYTRTADSGNNIKVLGSITQDTNGKISYSEVDLPLANITTAGLMSITTQSFIGKKSFNTGIYATDVETKKITSPTFYGNFVTCESSANDDKVVNVQSMVNFALEEGVHVFVQFADTNTKSSPTFKINNTEARPMLLHTRYQSSPMQVGTTVYDSWQRGEVVELVYSQTYWWVNKPYYVKEANNANTATLATTATTANKTAQALTISLNGTPNSFDGSTAKSLAIYSPTISGTSGQILKSSGSGNAPTWEYQYNLDAGKLISISYPDGINQGNAKTPVYFSYGIPSSCSMTSGKTTLTTGTSASAKLEIAYCDYYNQEHSKILSPVDIDNIPETPSGTHSCAWKTFSSTKTFYLTYQRNAEVLKITMNSFDSSIWYEGDVTVRFNLDKLVKTCMGNNYSIDAENLEYCSCVITSGRKNVGGGDGIIYNQYISEKELNNPYLYISRDSFGGGSSYGMSAEITLIIKNN